MGGKGALIQDEKSATLKATNMQTLFVPTLCIQGNTIDRKIENGGNGTGVNIEVSYTLNTIDRHAVCTTGGNNCINPMDSQHNRLYTTDGPSPCLRAGTESIGQIPKIVCEK